jgi:hypothetical protein
MGSHCYDLQELFSEITSSAIPTSSDITSSLTTPTSTSSMTQQATSTSSIPLTSSETTQSDLTQPVTGPLLVLVSITSLGLIVLIMTRLVIKDSSSE